MDYSGEFENIKTAFKRVKEDNLFLLQRIEQLEQQVKSQRREFFETFELVREKMDLEEAHRMMQNMTSAPAKTKKVATTQKITTKFRGNSNSKLLHTMTCPYGKKISDDNTAFFKSKDDAYSKGYTPCNCLKES